MSYNSEETIRKTIESVENQTYPNIEYIVVDGASTDGTISILEERSSVVDCWISEPDKGIYDAMNKGIRISTGDVVGIINSDDWYEEDAVQRAVDGFRKNVGLVHGAMRIWGEDGSVKSLYGAKSYIPESISAPFNHPTCFVRKEVYKEIGLYETKYKIASDYDFMIRFIDSKYEAKYIDRVISNFRQGGITSKESVPVIEFYELLRNNGYGLGGTFASIIARLLKRYSASLVRSLFNSEIKNYIRSFIPYHKK